MVAKFPSCQKSHSECGSAVAASRSFRVAVWDMCSGSSTPTHSQVAVALSLPGKLSAVCSEDTLELCGNSVLDRHGLQAEKGCSGQYARGCSSRKEAASVCSVESSEEHYGGRDADVATKGVVSRELALGRTPGRGHHVMVTKTTQMSRGETWFSAVSHGANKTSVVLPPCTAVTVLLLSR